MKHLLNPNLGFGNRSHDNQNHITDLKYYTSEHTSSKNSLTHPPSLNKLILRE